MLEPLDHQDSPPLSLRQRPPAGLWRQRAAIRLLARAAGATRADFPPTNQGKAEPCGLDGVRGFCAAELAEKERKADADDLPDEQRPHGPHEHRVDLIGASIDGATFSAHWWGKIEEFLGHVEILFVKLLLADLRRLQQPTPNVQRSELHVVTKRPAILELEL